MARGPAAAARPTWRVEVEVPAAATTAFETALAAAFPIVSAFEVDDGADEPATWKVEIHLPDRPDPGAIHAAVAAASLAAGLRRPPDPLIAEVPATDWLAATHAAFPPLRLGRFLVRGSHVEGPVPRTLIALEIDAATAFGTGEHPTTAACLAMIERLARRRRPARILDMGSGTGILALAAARLWPSAAVLAADIDPEAVRVGIGNARRNGLATRVRTMVSAGFANPEIDARGPYELVVANILARPLMTMAGDLARALAPGGVAVLSGLLTRQERMVLWPYRERGLALRGRLRRGAWSCLALERASVPR